MTGKKGLVSDCFSRQDVNYAHVVSLALGMYYANERKAQCAVAVFLLDAVLTRYLISKARE